MAEVDFSKSRSERYARIRSMASKERKRLLQASSARELAVARPIARPGHTPSNKETP